MNSSVVRTELSYFAKTDELHLGTGRSGQPAHTNAKPPKIQDEWIATNTLYNGKVCVAAEEGPSHNTDALTLARYSLTIGNHLQSF